MYIHVHHQVILKNFSYVVKFDVSAYQLRKKLNQGLYNRQLSKTIFILHYHIQKSRQTEMKQ